MPDTILPLDILGAPLPIDFQGTPQQLFDAMLARMTIGTSLGSVALLTIGNVAPTSNVGPWLKNGTTLYVWSSTTGSYVPATVEFPSLRYIAQQAAPDPAVYVFWIKLNTSGIPIAIYYYSAGAWSPIGNSLIPEGTPVSTDAGVKGQMKRDTSYLYVCGKDASGGITDTWKRIALVAY